MPATPHLSAAVVALDTGDGGDLALALADALVLHEVAQRCLPVASPPALPPALRRWLTPYACLGDDAAELDDELARASTQAIAARWAGPLKGRAVQSHGLGSLDETLQRAAERSAAALAVTARGDGGSPLHTALRRSAVPVAVAVRTVGEGIRRIVVALDLTRESAELLRAALELAVALDARVYPLHVLPQALVQDHARLLPPEADDRAARGRKEAIKAFQQVESQLELPFAIAQDAKARTERIRVEFGDPAALIVRHSADADLLMLTRARASEGSGRTLGSVAHRVLETAECNLWFHPAPARLG